MNIETKKELRTKIWSMYGLSNILKYDIDEIRKDAKEFNLDKLQYSIKELNITVQRLLLVVEQIDYIIKMDNIEGS